MAARVGELVGPVTRRLTPSMTQLSVGSFVGFNGLGATPDTSLGAVTGRFYMMFPPWGAC